MIGAVVPFIIPYGTMSLQIISLLNYSATISGAAMKFEEIPRTHIEGATLFGKTLDSLHSEGIDSKGLKEWVNTFANLLSLTDVDPETGYVLTFHDLFLEELVDFCILIASYDSSVSDRELGGIRWLVDSKIEVDRDYVDSEREYIKSSGFANKYPVSFMLIVNELAQGDEKLLTAAQIAFFYRQVARFIDSIDHRRDFDRDCPASDYVESFFKYIERVSVIDFAIPENERSIKEVRATWAELDREARDEMLNGFYGTWQAIRGSAVNTGDFSVIHIQPDGTGYLLKKKLFGANKVPIAWSLFDKWPFIRVDDLDIAIFVMFTDEGDIVANFMSHNPRFDHREALYRRVSS